MTTKENNENIDETNKEGKINKIEDLVSSYRKDVLQRYFGEKGGKNLLYSIIGICLLRGLIGKFAFHQPFLYSFLYPLILVGLVSVLYITLKLISFKSPKISKILSGILLIACCTILILVFLLLIVLLLNKLLHFWF
ncbi:hypothetical protein [Clostridium fungisolvens]|uniref:Uncharacterized protein n=1 Tax=Clostridium fungisolvens TaxID=1604897 RepID=A0A6V8SIH5_9CLOT|nr:hypothetical protein [Clostridium fungisolvens]GFP77007.1 hypothetical protein bsdtw1_03120 [Clostridium fungisolvens]